MNLAKYSLLFASVSLYVNWIIVNELFGELYEIVHVNPLE